MAGDLPKDAATIQRAKGPEFYSLGLVLGYSYAGSPVIQPSAGPPDLTDATTYRPTTDPGARLPHCWLPDGTSLYDHLGPGFTLLCPPRDDGSQAAVAAAPTSAPATAESRSPSSQAPPSYPWPGEFLLVRPDQHIAWRAADPADIDIEAAVGHGVDVPAAGIPRSPEGDIG